MGKRALGRLLTVLGLLTVTMGFSFFQQVGSGMAGFWRLEEAAGPTSADSSGVLPANNGTWSATNVASLPGPANTPTQLGGASTACLNFTGNPGQVSIPGTAALSITGDITIAFWMRPAPNAAAEDWTRVVGKGNGTQRNYGVWRYPGTANRIKFQQYNSGGGSVLDLDTTAGVPDNTWTHVACRVAVNAATVFFNGTLQVSGNRGGTPGSVAADPVTFGYAGYHSYYQGRLDDVRIYSRALSDAEIAALASGAQGPPAPTLQTATPGHNTVALTWNASGATVYNVKRATVAGGPYTTIASNVPTMSYTDNTAVNGTTYYYVVSGVSFGEGANSNELSARPNPVTALPNSGLFTTEAGGTAVFNIRLTTALAVGQSITFTVQCLDASEGQVSGGGQPIGTTINFVVNGPQAAGFQVPITVTGVDDLQVDPATLYQVSVSMTSTDPTFNGITIPNVQLTNNDDDIPGITLSRTGGLVTTEGGGTDTFSVSLNTQPTAPVTMSLTSSAPGEGTVSTGTVTFNTSAGGPNGWNFPQVITVTGVDDAALDFAIGYTIITGNLSSTDGNYNTMPVSDVSVVNMDDEPIPTLPAVWGGGSSGGCGLLGPELLLPFALLGLWRRRSVSV